MNLFLTEDGVLKLGYYGLLTQAKCYSIKKTDCDGVRSFAPAVFRGEYEMRSDVWSFGIALLEMMGITPYRDYENDHLPTMDAYIELPYKRRDVTSPELVDFLNSCFEMEVNERGYISELMNVSVM